MPQDRAGGPAEPSSPEAGRAWSGHDGAEAFAAVEAGTDWLLGYPFVFKALSLPGGCPYGFRQADGAGWGS